jgi:hypothetical protein
MLDKKINYLINNFKISEIDANRIFDICKKSHHEKYIVWLAKEFKKDNQVIENNEVLIQIFDWVSRKKINILNYSFENALENSKKWHEENFSIKKTENTNSKDEDPTIIYRCKDKKHFFKLLTPFDLKDEGDMMGNCIGGYGEKVKNGKSIIISLRDEKNMPHVDIEIDARTGESLQVRGKQNEDPIKKYKSLIIEYVFNIMKEDSDIDNELKEIILNGL